MKSSRIWQIPWDLWEHRNLALHNHQALLARHTLYSTIRTEYVQGCEDFSPTGARLFSLSLEELLAKRRSYLEQWVARVQAERSFLLQDPSTKLIRRQRSLLQRFLRLQQIHQPSIRRPNPAPFTRLFQTQLRLQGNTSTGDTSSS